MDLVMRNTSEDDLDQCLRLAPDRFLYDPGGLAAAAAGCGRTSLPREPGRRAFLSTRADRCEVLFFGFSVFVTDARAEGYHSLLCPGHSRAGWLRELRRGRPSVSLRSSEIGRRKRRGRSEPCGYALRFCRARQGDDGSGRQAALRDLRIVPEASRGVYISGASRTKSSIALLRKWVQAGASGLGWYTEERLRRGRDTS